MSVKLAPLFIFINETLPQNGCRCFLLLILDVSVLSLSVTNKTPPGAVIKLHENTPLSRVFFQLRIWTSLTLWMMRRRYSRQTIWTEWQQMFSERPVKRGWARDVNGRGLQMVAMGMAIKRCAFYPRDQHTQTKPILVTFFDCVRSLKL